MREPTVTASAPKALVDFAVARGADREALMRRAGIRPRDLVDPNGRVSVVRYVALIDAGVELCDDPSFALKFGEHVSMEHLSMVALIVLNADSAEDGGAKMNHYA